MQDKDVGAAVGAGGTYLAATSALNGSMDGKCNGCMIK